MEGQRGKVLGCVPCGVLCSPPSHARARANTHLVECAARVPQGGGMEGHWGVAECAVRQTSTAGCV